MKLTLLWILAGSWAVVLCYVAWTYFREGFVADMGFLDRPKPIFTGIGALTVGGVPLLLTALVHRYQRKRLRDRLEKERERIARQLERLDEREGRGRPVETAGASEG